MSVPQQTDGGAPSHAHDQVWTPEAQARGAVAAIDLDALRHNVGVTRSAAPGAEVMAVVKADAYGHGLVPCARAALQGGATWLGVALPLEALTLRRAGIGSRLLTWLLVPASPFADLVGADIDVAVSAAWSLEAVRDAARETGRCARVHLKVDSGMSRNGSTYADWPALVAAARDAELAGEISVVGILTHFASADEPTSPSIGYQLDVFRRALDLAAVAGLAPEVRHASNSAATFAVPDARFDLVRLGIAMYGVTPGLGIGSAASLGLEPVMSLRAQLALVKRVPSGSGVGYGHHYTTAHESWLGVVPVGYADGVPRAGSNVGPVLAAGALRHVAGRVSMDQIVVDLGDDRAEPGDEVVIFGAGGPSADDWAAACGTIGYEIVTRIGPRVPRVHLGVIEP